MRANVMVVVVAFHLHVVLMMTGIVDEMVVVVVVILADQIHLEEEEEAVQASRPSWTFVLRASSVIVASETDSIYVDSFGASFATRSVTSTDRVSLQLLLLRPHLHLCLRYHQTRFLQLTPARVS